MDQTQHNHVYHIGSAEDDAQLHFSNPLRDLPQEMLMGQELLSLDSGLSVCDEEDSILQNRLCQNDIQSSNDRGRHALNESSQTSCSKTKKDIEFLMDIVADQLSEKDRSEEYAYVPKMGE